jgi:hypothetical protein
MANPNDVTLGCADEYAAIITARDLETYAARLDWSEITWSRVLDDISEATVRVPDIFGGLRCNIELGTALVPWRFGLRIERNGSEVWSGPITAVERPERNGGGDDHVVVTAHDTMIWATKRTTNDFLSFTSEDAGVIFRTVLDAGMAPDNLMGLNCPEFDTGYLMTREVVPLDFEYTYDILSELAESAVDFFVLNGELAVFDIGDFGWWVLRDGVKTRIAPTADPFGRYIYGLFTDSAYETRPGYRIDGFQQGNNILIPGADSGEAGFRRFWQASDVISLDGLLTYVHVSSLYRPQSGGVIVTDAVFQQLADTNLALRSGPVVTLSGGSLSQSAPVRIEDLLPGSLWAIDLADAGIAYLLDVQRLKRVDVTVQAGSGGIVERVAPTLIPIGSDETVIG